jgi:hypothetical protein
MQRLLEAIHGDPDAMSGFVSALAGVVSPAEFFGPQNVERMARPGAEPR